MVSLAQGRFSLPEPDAVISRDSAPVDTGIADTIKAFGSMAAQAHKGHMEGQLYNELQESGEIINTINQGEDAIRAAVRKGMIDPTSLKFKRIAGAVNQGKISQQRAQIEAEVILRESISRAPGFADDFRSEAKQILGSQTIGGLYESGPDENKTGPLTDMQKKLQQAESYVASGMYDNINDAFIAINQAEIFKMEEQQTGAKIQQAKVAAPKVAIAASRSMAARANTIMLSALQEIKASGQGIQNTEAYVNGIRDLGDQVKMKYEQDMAASGQYYTDDNYDDMRSRVDEQIESYVGMLQEQDALKMMSKNVDLLKAAAEGGVIEAMPEIYAMRFLPEEAQRAHIEYLIAGGDDERKKEELLRAVPEYKFADRLSTATKEHVVPLLKAMSDKSVAAVIEDIDGDSAAAIIKTETQKKINGQPSGFTYDEIVAAHQAAGLPQVEISTIAADPAKVFADLTPETAQASAATIMDEQTQQLNSVIGTLSAKGYNLAFDQKDGFYVVDSSGKDVKPRASFDPRGFAMPARLRRAGSDAAGVGRELDYLNKYIVPTMRNSEWARLAGFADSNDWVRQSLNKVNIGTALVNRQADPSFGGTMDLGQQAELFKALTGGDLDGAIKTLQQAKVAGFQKTEFGLQDSGQVPQFGTIDRTPNAQAGTVNSVSVEGDKGLINQNTMPAGFTISEQLIADGEGRHSATKGDGKTAGWGFDLVNNPRAEQIKEQYGLTGKTNAEVIKYFDEHPEDADALLKAEVAAHRDELRAAWKGYDNLDPIRQAAMDNLAYNVGVTKLLKFENMLNNLGSGQGPQDFNTATIELLFSQGKDGKWKENEGYTQVGARAGAVAYMLANGRMPKDRATALAYLNDMRTKVLPILNGED